MIRLYRVLLLLYPASFRRAYAEDMCAVFAERLGRARGRLDRLGLLGEALLDTLANASAAHLEILAQDVRYAV